MDEEQQDGFVRQRRNLMVASLVLLFSEVTELKVEKISAFGTELLVGKAQAVTLALWVAAVYWLIRFYQYSKVGPVKKLPQAILARIHALTPEVAKALFIKRNSQGILAGISHDRIACGGSHIEKQGPAYLEVHCRMHLMDEFKTSSLQD